MKKKNYMSPYAWRPHPSCHVVFAIRKHLHRERRIKATTYARKLYLIQALKVAKAKRGLVKLFSFDTKPVVS